MIAFDWPPFLKIPSSIPISSSRHLVAKSELKNLVKDKVLIRQDGKELLDKQLGLIKILKEKIISETNNEMELFKKFKEASKDNPSLTYENFCKKWVNK